jgi:hypothetical protein
MKLYNFAFSMYELNLLALRYPADCAVSMYPAAEACHRLCDGKQLQYSGAHGCMCEIMYDCEAVVALGEHKGRCGFFECGLGLK